MPMYEILCKKCNHVSVELVHFYLHYTNTETEETAWKRQGIICQNCGSDDTVPLLGTPSPPVFKGTGFHATDYKDKK